MANRVKCASNLRQIGYAMVMYANNETRNGQSFPRTPYVPDDPLIGADAGSTTPTPGWNQGDSFGLVGGPSPVGINNVMASFFLVAKTQDLSPYVFNCPSDTTQPEEFSATSQPTSVRISPLENYSCWASPANQHLSYSMQSPFPTSSAVQSGFKWNITLAGDFAIAADINPGTPAILSVTPSSSAAQMRTANSTNHFGDGQNVLYADGHVDWVVSPFGGVSRVVSGGQYNDNIYMYGDLSSTKGIIGPPQDNMDSILLPVIGANPPLRPLMQRNPMLLPVIILGALILIGGGAVIAIVLITRRRKPTPPPVPPMPA